MAILRKFGGVCFGLAILGLAWFGTVSPAHSALIHNFINTGDNSVIGQIEFDASGPGNVVAFSLDTTAFGGPIFDLSDLCDNGGTAVCQNWLSTFWQIDDAWNITRFVLSLSLDDTFGPGRFLFAMEFSNPASLGFASAFITVDCSVTQACLDYIDAMRANAPMGIVTQAVHKAPEPAAVFLFAGGLILLAGLARPKSRQALAA